MRFYFIHLGLMIVLLTSCGHNTHYSKSTRIRTIDISSPISGISSLSEIANGIDYIQLETNDSCLLGKPEKIIIEEEGIFISDVRQLLHFDLNGKFINKISESGRGPGEFVNILDFYIDDPRHQIVLMQSDYIFTYSLEGVFIKKQCTPVPQRLFSRISNGQFVFLYDWPNFLLNNGYSLNITDSLGGAPTPLLFRGWTNTKESDLKYGSSGYCALDYYTDTLTYWENRSDTVYSITNQGLLIPKYFIKRKNGPPFSATSEEIFSMKYQIITKFLETKKYVFFPQVLDDPNSAIKFICYNKTTQKAAFIEHENKLWGNGANYPGFLNDIDGGWYFLPSGITSTGDPFSFFWGLDLKEKIMSDNFKKSEYNNESNVIVNISKKSEVYDNPIIMIIKTANE